MRRARGPNLALVVFYFPPTRRSRRTRAYRRRWTRENDRCNRSGQQYLLALRRRATRTRGFIGSGGMEDEAVGADNRVLAATGENGQEAGIAR